MVTSKLHILSPLHQGLCRALINCGKGSAPSSLVDARRPVPSRASKRRSRQSVLITNEKRDTEILIPGSNARDTRGQPLEQSVDRRDDHKTAVRTRVVFVVDVVDTAAAAADWLMLLSSRLLERSNSTNVNLSVWHHVPEAVQVSAVPNGSTTSSKHARVHNTVLLTSNYGYRRVYMYY